MNVTATLFGQMITFGILVWFVMKYLWGPVTQAMEDRQQRVADGLAEGEKGRNELKLAKKGATKRLVEAKGQAADIVAKAEQRASEIIEEAKNDAKEEAARVNAAAKAEIDQEVQRAREDLRSRVADLVVAGAGKVLRKEINAAEHERLLKQLATQL